MNLSKITITEYLSQKGIPFREDGKELITKCLFNDCDRDSKGNEAHLYFSKETGQYDCKKCGEKGNLITLAKHFGDAEKKPRQSRTFNDELVEKCHAALPAEMREYLNKRGVNDEAIETYKLGYGTFYGKRYITIPIMGEDGYLFFKLRQDPREGDGKITYPKGAEACLFGLYGDGSVPQVICEGELDALAVLSLEDGDNFYTALTSTHGAGTFKEEWVDDDLKRAPATYVCYDNDEAGKKGSLRVLKILHEAGVKNLFHITLPDSVGEHGDITDYLTKLKLPPADLFTTYAKPYPERIDTSQFSPMNPEKLLETLGLTIKYDMENKLATFLCELSAYTESSQFNISYNAPSSTGKSYIPTEIARLFPQDDVMEIAYCSPTAFFHDVGQYDKEKNQQLVDLSRKVLIFLDQPHNELLARLRPLLSHDKKEIAIKITDKTQKNGTKTKNILLRGYPSVIFCTAGLQIDEQEATRFLLLSPEVNQNKIQQGISATIRKEADSESFVSWLEENPDRALLKERIRAIKLEEIRDINIASPEKIEERFLEKNKMLKPRHQRDIKRLLSLIKSLALLNVWWRERDGSTITANADDIEEAFKLWDKISVSQELNLPPYIYNLYTEVILPAWEAKNSGRSEAFEEITGKLGISRQEVLAKHFAVYGRMLDSHQLRQQILPMLETAGLIVEEQDPNDKRKMMIFPASQHQLSQEKKNDGNEGGVKISEEERKEIQRKVQEEVDNF